MRQAHNFLLAITQSAWTACIGLALVPVYIHFLGTESYGVIGFYIALISLLQILDFGMTPTISREAAKYASQNMLPELSRLCLPLAVVMWLLAIMFATLMISVSSLISEHWLQHKTTNPAQVADALIWMGVALAARLLINFYHGILIGISQLHISSLIHIVFVTATGILTIASLVFVKADIKTFFIVQLLINCVHVITVRLFVVRKIGYRSIFQLNWSPLGGLVKFSGTMTFVTLSGLVISQMDKLLLSRLTTLDQVGVYSAASMLAIGLFVLIGPVYNILFPKFTALVGNGDASEASILYLRSTSLVLAGLLPIACTLSLHAEQILFLWTRNRDLAVNAAPILSVLVLGYAVNGVMYPAYALQLAHGRADLPLQINVGLLLLLLPVSIPLILKYGAYGAAIGWLVVAVFYVMVGTYMTKKHVARELKIIFFATRLFFPVAIFLCLCISMKYFFSLNDYSAYWMIITLTVACVISALYLNFFEDTRHFVKSLIIHLKYQSNHAWKKSI
jgi:O-antigen/teichoic acid export membrane protein